MKKAMIIMAVLGVACIAYATTNEITVQTFLKVNKDAVQLQRSTGTLLIQMAGTRYSTYVLTLTTTNQFLSKGNVANAGWCYMRNLSTNPTHQANITFDGGTTTSLVLKAEEPALFRLAPGALVTNFTAAASSSSFDFEITVTEN